RAVARAVVSHGHSDHARPGHGEVLATPETLAIMRLRLGEGAGGVQRPLAWGEAVEIGGVTVWLAPAGHVLGSARGVPEHGGEARKELAGEIVLAPPSAIADRWARRLPEPVVALASGWMRVKQRAKARGVELPLVISDHADWDELLATIAEVKAPEVWVTHGR